MSSPISVSWQAVDGAASYNLYRRDDILAAFGDPINQTPILTTSHIDYVEDTRIYYYSVSSIDGSSVESFPGTTQALSIALGESVPRVDFTASKFNNIIEQKGYNVQWQKAVFCPCGASTKSSQSISDINCQLCNSKGFIYVQPSEIKVVIRSLTKNYQFNAEGSWAIGSFSVTSKSNNRLGFYDRLILLDSVSTYSQSVIKGVANTTDSLKFPAEATIALIDINGNSFTENTDYIISATGGIDWNVPGGSEPNTGQPYGVTYTTKSRLIVTDFSHEIRSTFSQKGTRAPIYTVMPQEVICRLEFFLT